MHLTSIDSRIGFKKDVNKYLKERDIDVSEDQFDFKKLIKNLADIEDKINIIIENYKPKSNVKIEDNKRVFSIFNIIRYSLLDYCLDPITNVELHKEYQCDKKDNVLNKYSRDSSLVDEIIEETEMFIYKRDIFCISIIKPLKHFN